MTLFILVLMLVGVVVDAAVCLRFCSFFFFKQKTAYEMRISDWSSDVCSSDLGGGGTVYPVKKWIELFLVEPSLNRARTDANDVYVEVIGETTLGGGGDRKSVV